MKIDLASLHSQMCHTYITHVLFLGLLHVLYINNTGVYPTSILRIDLYTCIHVQDMHLYHTYET